MKTNLVTLSALVMALVDFIAEKELQFNYWSMSITYRVRDMYLYCAGVCTCCVIRCTNVHLTNPLLCEEPISDVSLSNVQNCTSATIKLIRNIHSEFGQRKDRQEVQQVLSYKERREL